METPGARNCGRELLVLVAVLMVLAVAPLWAQDAASQGTQVEGIVRDAGGKPVGDASVVLREADHSESRSKSLSKSLEVKTNAEGFFAFATVQAGTYTVSVEKPGFHGANEDSIKLSPGEKKHCEFVLVSWGASSTGIELDDRPNFTVAGISDSTGSGGHGSETRMRTGEVLAKETLHLESGEPAGNAGGTAAPGTLAHASENSLRAALVENPRGFEENHNLGEFYLRSSRCREAIPLLDTASRVNAKDHANAFDLAQALKDCGEFARARELAARMLANDKDLPKQQGADLHRMLGDLDEKLEDPLAAVREYERAAALDGSEQNYFAWGAELLLHRAAAPAIEVFGKGARLHPESARMLSGLGAALYTSGSAEDAAKRLCEASDLNRANSAAYLFLGKIQEAAAAALPCAEEKLARFAQEQPANALANYYYAVALWKRDRGSTDADSLRRVQALLEKASAMDAKLDVAYLQLGNLQFARGAFPEAITAYQRAIAANPDGSQAHYRLGQAYKRNGEDAKAEVEIDKYKELDQTEAATIERQRRELRQFLFVLGDQPGASRATSDPAVPSAPK